jgi:hypothetical protein
MHGFEGTAADLGRDSMMVSKREGIRPGEVHACVRVGPLDGPECTSRPGISDLSLDKDPFISRIFLPRWNSR